MWLTGAATGPATDQQPPHWTGRPLQRGLETGHLLSVQQVQPDASIRWIRWPGTPAVSGGWLPPMRRTRSCAGPAAQISSTGKTLECAASLKHQALLLLLLLPPGMLQLHHVCGLTVEPSAGLAVPWVSPAGTPPVAAHMSCCPDLAFCPALDVSVPSVSFTTGLCRRPAEGDEVHRHGNTVVPEWR